MIAVKLFITLVPRSKTGQATFSVDYVPGMTAGDIMAREGFVGHDAEGIMPVVNDAQVKPGHPLQDGDRVELLVSIQGG
jgi:sulfur carrier protein ThiS